MKYNREDIIQLILIFLFGVSFIIYAFGPTGWSSEKTAWSLPITTFIWFAGFDLWGAAKKRKSE